MARLLRFAAAVALGGLATAGPTACTGGGSDASPSPTPVVTVTEDTPSPSPTPTFTPEEELLAQIPEDARGESFPEAINFSRFFLELYGPMFEPPYDTELFKLLCTDESNYCNQALIDVADTRAVGAYSQGGEFTWSSDAVHGGPNEDGTWNVTQGFSRADITTYAEDGTVYGVSKGGVGVVGVDLRFESGAWRVVAVGFVYEGQ